MPLVTRASAGTAAYDNLTFVNDPAFNRMPAPFAAVPTTEAHVQAVLQCAAANHARVAVKSGGHSFEGYSSVDVDHGAFAMVLAGMARVAWLPDNRTLQIGAGARLGHVYDFVEQSGSRRVFSGGLCPSVGVGGYLSGGGIGPVVRALGLGMDSVVGVRVALANGTAVVTANATNEHADLFWAVRGGGGGNWGVITSYLVATHPALAAAYSYARICYNVTTAAELAATMAYIFPRADALPRAVTLDFVFYDTALCIWAVVQGDTPTAQTLLAEFATPTDPAVAAPVAAWREHATLPPLLAQYAAERGYSEFSDSSDFCKTCLLDSSVTGDRRFLDVVAQSYYTVTALGASCSVHGLQWGGRVGALAADATAFPWRNTTYMLYYDCDWASPAERALAERAAAMFTAATAPWACLTRSYVNFIDADLADWRQAYYGPNLARLQAIKAQYVPPTGTGPLRFPQEL